MAVIEKRKGKKGTRWRVLIRKNGEKPISKTFSKKTIAEQWAKKTELDIERGEFCNDDSNFGDIIKRYVVEVGKHKNIGNTQLSCLETVRKSLGHLKLNDLTNEVWYDYAISREIKPASRLVELVYVGVILKASKSLWRHKPNLQEYKTAMENLARFGIIAPSDERDRRVSDFELELIFDNLNARIPVQEIVCFAVHTAMRIGEICSLRWKDLREDGKSIVIRSRKHPRKKRDQLVPLLPKAREIIWRQPKDSEYIFPFIGRSVSKAFKRAVKKAKIEDLRFHDLRHEGISRLFEMGFDSMVVAVFSGHRDINMLKRYTHINANKILKMLDCNPIDLAA